MVHGTYQKFTILCTNNHKSNIHVGKILKNQNFPQSVKTIFAKYLQFYMWFYKGIKVNPSAIMQTITVALVYKINPVQITTITAENTKNSLYSVPHTIEKLINSNCENFSPIVKQNLALCSSVRLLLFHYY